MKPNFVIVGALKAGTTSLAEWLRSHPDVFIPELKEPRFFLYDERNRMHRARSRAVFPIRSSGEYKDLFRGAESFKAVGEASPQYLHSAIACGRLLESLPDARIVVSLRHPVKRAYSQYWMRVREGVESGSFADSILQRHSWVEYSYYSDAVERYINSFGRGRVCVVVFEELVSAPTKSLAELCAFLELDSDATELLLPKENVGHSGARGMLSKVLDDRQLRLVLKRIVPKTIRRAFRPFLGRGEPIPPLEASQLDALSECFRGDISRTSDLIGIDLAQVWWPKG